MADAYFRKFAEDTTEVYAAGIEKAKVDRVVIALLMEDGIDATEFKQHRLEEFRHIDFDFILTYDDLAAAESHHLPPKPVKYHFDFHKMIPEEMSKEEKEEVYRRIRDKIKRTMRTFIRDHFTKVKED